MEIYPGSTCTLLDNGIHHCKEGILIKVSLKQNILVFQELIAARINASPMVEPCSPMVEPFYVTYYNKGTCLPSVGQIYLFSFLSARKKMSFAMLLA